MKKSLYVFILILLLTVGNSSINICVAQENTTESNTTQIVTANGVRAVDVDKHNEEVSDKLKKLREKQDEKQEEKRNMRYLGKLIGKIIIGLLIVGGAFLWRKLRNKKNSQEKN